MPADARRIAGAAVADAVAVLVFVALGRGSHHESGSFVASTLRVAAPFLLGALLGWVVARAWRAPAGAATGIIVWITTVVAGMLLRHFPFHRGTATAFIIVASLFLGLFLVGWRVVAEWLGSRRT